MNPANMTSPDEPVFDYEDAGPITDEEIEFCALQPFLRMDYDEAGPLTDDDSLVCAEECFLAYDREEAAQENTLRQ